MVGMVFVAPVFSADSIPYRTRMMIAFLLSAVLYPVSVNYLPPLPSGPVSFIGEATAQAALGIIIGFLIQMIFAAFQIAGELFSVQSGLSFAEVLDPASQTTMPIIGTLKSSIGLLLFLSLNFPVDGITAPAYLHMVRALAFSIKAAPTMMLDMTTLGGLLSTVDQTMGVLFVTALKIGIPAAGILFIATVALGLIGRAAPQLNLMNMGVHINIILGLTLLLVLSPIYIPIMGGAFQSMYDIIGTMLRDWPGKHS
jgi:flagellar biosynthetic protein FliR